MNLFARAVMDTSTLVSAALRVNSVPSQALSKALGSFQLCVSDATLAELVRVLMRPKFDRYAARSDRAAFIDLMGTYAVHFEVTESLLRTVTECRDPTDAKFLVLALACDAEVLVASDADLLSLNPYRAVPIILPAAFLVYETN